MKKLMGNIIAVPVVGAFLVSCANAGYNRVDDMSVELSHSLAYMWNEERLAKDIYLVFNNLYPTKQFERIATRSETKHIAAVEGLIAKYDINILDGVNYQSRYSEQELRAMPAGVYGVAAIQELYNQLYSKGRLSKVDALQAACMVEVVDVDDLNEFIAKAQAENASDMVQVYDKLRAGSYNHYWAFDNALKAEGIREGCASAGAEFAKTPSEYPSTHGYGKGEDGKTCDKANGRGNGRGQGRGQGQSAW